MRGIFLNIEYFRPDGFGPLLAGNSNNGSNAGVRNVNSNNRVSNANANASFRLYRLFLPVLNHQALALAKRVIIVITVLVAKAKALFVDGTKTKS